MTFHLLVEDAAIAGGAPTLKVTEGDDVTFVLESNDAMEVHLHGYDLTANLAPGAAVTLSFRADIVGRFPAEPHDHAGNDQPALFYLEIHPQ